ncbi:MAG: sodium:solute symporter, partial [Flavobacteriaceae bacterium]|nr:sodium:solute symporter [Flavobacteriaceae bacterium]
YAIIGLVLMPLYYRLNLTSIYTYLDGRFGRHAYKTGASFFLLSRTVIAAFRLFLVANVLQIILFDNYGVPFWANVIITILLIWLYTFKGGIKTIVWTDTLQTLFMLVAVGVVIHSIQERMDIHNLFAYVSESKYSRIFFFDDLKSADYFWKQFLSGAFIAVVMTGLDQDMMQKNLTCKTLGDAQKNMFWFTIVLVIVNFFFLSLGVLLTEYAASHGIDAHKDALFPTLAMEGNLGYVVPLFFVLGLIAATYSSADGTLTALTTSFSIDILEIKKKKATQQVRIRKQVHIMFSVIMALTILIFKYFIADESVIAKLFQFAGYTYGPLLGLYAYGMFTKWSTNDKLIPVIAILAPALTYFINYLCIKYFAFDFGFFVLIINGLITFIGLLSTAHNKPEKHKRDDGKRS